MADGKAPVCAAGGAPVTKQYIYSLYDAKTGALRAKGTPQELMEHGYYNRAESVCTGYAHQKKKKAKPKKWRLEREEKQPKPKAEPDHRTGTQMREVWFYSCAMRREPEAACRKRAGRRSRELRSRTSCSEMCMSCAFTTLRPGKQAKKS